MMIHRQLIFHVSILLRKLTSDRLNDEVMQQASNVASGLLLVNAAANFFVYCAIGNSFRRVLLELLHCRPDGKMPANPSNVQSRKHGVELASVRGPAEAANNK